MRISDWSSDVCSSDLERERADEMRVAAGVGAGVAQPGFDAAHRFVEIAPGLGFGPARREDAGLTVERVDGEPAIVGERGQAGERSEEHTSELQSLMRISYAVFCLKKKTIISVTLSLTLHYLHH